jgi:hypothetical protein
MTSGALQLHDIEDLLAQQAGVLAVNRMPGAEALDFLNALVNGLHLLLDDRLRARCFAENPESCPCRRPCPERPGLSRRTSG